MRARASCQPRAAWLALGALIGVGDFVNASVMLRGIKRRSEHEARQQHRPASAPTVVLRGAEEVRSPRRCSQRRHSCAAGICAGGQATTNSRVRCPVTNSCAIRRSKRDPRDHDRRATECGVAVARADRLRPRRVLQLRPPRQRGPRERAGDPARLPASTRSATGCRWRQRSTRRPPSRSRASSRNRWLLWEKPHSTWAWTLAPLEDGRTRLVVRLKDRYAWREVRPHARCFL